MLARALGSDGPRDHRSVFVALPFGSNQSELVWNVIDFTCNGLNLRAARADRLQNTGLVLEDIWEGIQRAGIVIADVTRMNPNVIYEVGLAHTVSKRVVLLCERGQELPFDLRSHRVIFYQTSSEGTKRLTDDLWEALRLLIPASVPSVIKDRIERSRRIIAIER